MPANKGVRIYAYFGSNPAGEPEIPVERSRPAGLHPITVTSRQICAKMAALRRLGELGKHHSSRSPGEQPELTAPSESNGGDSRPKALIEMERQHTQTQLTT